MNFWDNQLKGKGRYAVYDWGECSWTAKDLLDFYIYITNRVEHRIVGIW